MRTAAEMYHHCLINHFGEGFSRSWSLKHLSIIEKALAPDEDILMCFIGLHNYKSMTKHDDYYAYAVTNKRLVLAQKKLIGQNFKTVEIDKINDVTMHTGLVMGTITIDSAREKINIGISKSVAQSINNRIHHALRSSKQHTVTPQPSATAPAVVQQAPSAADEILKYKNLLDIGAVTQEEFNAKKQQLLGL